MNENEFVNNEIDAEIDNVLQELVCSGEILAKCPKCDIPLNTSEFLDLKCNSCGEINYSKIKFQNKCHCPTC